MMDAATVVETWSGVRKWFWNPALWLPPNTTWEMLLDRTDGVYYPDFYDLWIPFPIALGLLTLRFLWERFVAAPIGRRWQISEALPRRALPNETLETAFRRHRKVLPAHHVVVGLAKQIDWSERQIERWWRRRRVQGKPSELKRFRETSWRFMFYVLAFWLGLYVLWDKPWLWDTKHFWYAYPMQPMTSDLYWYYMLEMSFYWSLVFSLFMDVKRKDFVENVIHHIVTLSLMVVSWSGNMTRIGTLVMCTHDAVDYILELAKLLKYLKWHKVCDALFVLFTVVWFLTRILFYPFRIIRSALFEGHVIIGCFTNIYYMYNGLLLVLQVLHIIWFYMILRMAYNFVTKGSNEKDTRSESETATNSEDEFVSYKPVVGHQSNNVSNNNITPCLTTSPPTQRSGHTGSNSHSPNASDRSNGRLKRTAKSK